MGEGDVAVLGQDVVLREKDALKDLLRLLPQKAQLGFSSLREKWSSRNDKGLMKIISAAKINDSLKVEYTCIDVDSDFITIGCNLGIVFMYSRHAKTLSRFICESKQIPVCSIKLLRHPNFIATGQFSGAITIFQYEQDQKSFQMKVLLKCTVESHHEAPVTSMQWTQDGTKLFTGDSSGNVAITVINMDEGKTHTVFICRENSPVTQISFSHTALLISTLQRTLIWPFNTKKVVQVGKQSRKVFGNFGACFFPPAGPQPTDEIVDVYAARPGLRLWKATIDGKVLTTMIFKDSVNKGEPIMETIVIPPHTILPTHQSEQKQFGSLIAFDNQFLVSWQGSSVWVMDPGTGYIIGCHSNLGCVSDVSACGNELYVLSKGDKHFIRQIVFETTIPCIVVEELDLNEHLVEDEEEERSSVFQFEDQDKLDKLIDEVGSKMIGAIYDVKSKVLEFKPFLSGEGYSTSDDNLKNDDVTSDENNIDNTNRPFESSNELAKSYEKSPEITITTNAVTPDEKKPQEEQLFNHLSLEAFPTNIVFEGTSLGTSPKKRRRTKGLKKGIMETNSIEEEFNDKSIARPSENEEFLDNFDFDNENNETETNLFLKVCSVDESNDISLDDNCHPIPNGVVYELQMDSFNDVLETEDSHYRITSETGCELNLSEKNNDLENIYALESYANTDGTLESSLNSNTETDTLKTPSEPDTIVCNECNETGTTIHDSLCTCPYLSSNISDNQDYIINKNATNISNEHSDKSLISTMENNTEYFNNGKNHADLVMKDFNDEASINEMHHTDLNNIDGESHSDPEFYFTVNKNSSNIPHLNQSVNQMKSENNEPLNEREIQSLTDIRDSHKLTILELSATYVDSLQSTTTFEVDVIKPIEGDDCSCNPGNNADNSSKGASTITLNNSKNISSSTLSNELDTNTHLDAQVTSNILKEDNSELLNSNTSINDFDKFINNNDIKITDVSPKTCLNDPGNSSDNNAQDMPSTNHIVDNLKQLNAYTPLNNEDDNVTDNKFDANMISKEHDTSIKTDITSNHVNISHNRQKSDASNAPLNELEDHTSVTQTVIGYKVDERTKDNIGSVKTDVTPSHVVNVKISHQRQGSNASVQSLSERCKEIRGEAIENSNVSQSIGTMLLGEDDTLEANIQPREEDLSVECNLEDSIDNGKLYPISPFPAPQIQSIYSQHSVNLADFSWSHFLEDESEYQQHLLDGITYDYDKIDVQNDLIESLDSITDVEDNLYHSPPECISGNELNHISSGPVKIKKKRSKNKYSSFPNSPCSSDLDGRPLNSPNNTAAGVLQDRLRYLADSWAGVETPTCGQIQFVACSDCLLWVIDNHDHIFYSGTNNQNYVWKKLDGKALLIASNQRGTVVWCIDRQSVAYFRTGIRDTALQGSGWEPFEKNMHYVAVDRDCVWAIKTNGDVFVRTGVTLQKPSGTGWITVKVASDLVQVTCLNGLTWALDIYNHVQIFKGDLSCVNSSADLVSDWCELPGIAASHVILGAKSVCWLIDREYGVWFNQDVSKDEDPLSGTWYQLSLGAGHARDSTWFSSILNYFTEGNEPKLIVANETAGVLILGKQGSLNVAHGHLLGTRWETKVPTQLSDSSWWSCVSAAGSDMNKGFIWALQPSGELFCFKSGGQCYKVHPPNRVVLKYCSAGPRSLYALTAGQDVYFRIGISDTCPQGLKWLKIDMMSQQNMRLMSISCGNYAVWAVDYNGGVWFQMGREERKAGAFSPAWVSVEECPLDGSKFTKIAVGPDDHIVWVCDDKNNVYARKNITDNFWVGTSWEVVSGTSGKDVTISSNHVWALYPNGDVMCRFGVSSSNVMGDYWKKVPGSFEQISVSPNDEIWGIDRQGHLYQRQTLLFYGSTLSSKAPSYNDLFSDHNDWEFI